MAALTGGPWKAFGSYLMAQTWLPEFDPLRDEIVTTPVWVRLSNIPINFYHKSILMGIARGLGRPIKVDLNTLNFERGRFARVCVEVNLKKPLKGTLMINGERYFVLYEGLTTICAQCGLYGHLVHACPRGASEKVIEMDVVGATPNVDSGQIMNKSCSMEDGFTPVRQRRSEFLVNRAAAPVGVGKGNVRRNSRDLIKGKDTEIIERISVWSNS